MTVAVIQIIENPWLMLLFGKIVFLILLRLHIWPYIYWKATRCQNCQQIKWSKVRRVAIRNNDLKLTVSRLRVWFRRTFLGGFNTEATKQNSGDFKPIPWPPSYPWFRQLVEDFEGNLGRNLRENAFTIMAKTRYPCDLIKSIWRLPSFVGNNYISTVTAGVRFRRLLFHRLSTL